MHNNKNYRKHHRSYVKNNHEDHEYEFFVNKEIYNKAKANKEHYLSMARKIYAEDRIEAEKYMQYADHYTRIINEYHKRQNAHYSKNVANFVEKNDVINDNNIEENNYEEQASNILEEVIS